MKLHLRIAFTAAVVVICGVLGPLQARAAVITFPNDLPGWTAAVGGAIVIEDFSDATLVPGLSITLGGWLPGSISGGVYHDRAVTSFDTTKNPVLAFAPAVLAFGANWDLSTDGRGGGLGLLLTFSDLTTTSLFSIPDTFTGQFYGFVSDKAVTSIRIVSADLTGEETFDMDNARFPGPGDGGRIPLPASLLLLTSGAAGLIGLRVMRSRRPLC